MKIQIKCRFTASVLFEHECEGNTVKLTVEKAASVDANLGGANLRGANLRGANLSDANLSGADLRGAYLGDANLGGANLRGANLRGADLGGANLRGADLRGANLSDAKEDFFQILGRARNEIGFLRDALINGRVDGRTYQGECACLVGTIANARQVNYQEIGIAPDSSRPAERWFMGIRKGDTPETNQISAITLGWVDEFLAKESI